jgi:allophanate hydrolase
VAERPSDAVAAAYERIERDGGAGIFIELVDRAQALDAASDVEAALADGAPLPLAGRTVAVKGNIDVAGHRTTAGCPSFGEVATQSAACVRTLERAGAIVVAITNLDQFATGLVGTRSPYGICPNAHWPGLVSGGSSSGSAVAVARGLVDLGIGTDTAGSGRVPAAANGIIGLKPTRGWISAAGVVPACQSLDCVSILARSVEEADVATRVMAGYDRDDPWSRRAVDVPADTDLAADTDLPADTATRIGGIDGPFDLEPFLAAGRLLYGGAFVAERYTAVGAFIEAHRAEVEEVVAEIILGASHVPAWQLARDRTELEQLRHHTLATWDEFDVIAVPTVSSLPTVAEVLADPIERNSALGTYTTFANLLDLCALTVPVGPASAIGPPESITLLAPAWRDAVLVSAARRVTRDTPAILRTR